MSKLRSLTPAILLTVLSVITGCSDEFISPLSQSTASEQVTSAEEKKLDSKKYHSKISLKPRQVVEFHSGNTIFNSFSSISILNCRITKSRLEIIGRANDALMLLGCNSSNFFAYSITIENKSTSAVELDVFLGGILKSKSGFNDKETL